MKTRILILHLTCFTMLLYFVIPISKEYFNYSTITTTYLPSFHPLFPKPKLFLISNGGTYNWTTLSDVIMVNNMNANIDRISKNGSIDVYELIVSESISPMEDHVIRWDWNLDWKLLYERMKYSLNITHEHSPDAITVKFDSTVGKPHISIQIFANNPIPINQCKISDLGMCLRVRYNYHPISDKSYPLLKILNSISLLHIEKVKLSLSSYAILVLGLLGLFSDITAVSIVATFLDMCYMLSYKLSRYSRPSIAKVQQVSVALLLLAMCTIHITHVTINFNQYNIESTMYEGPHLIELGPIKADICVHHYDSGDTSYVQPSANITDISGAVSRFFVNGCSSSPTLYSLGNNLCATLVSSYDCSMADNESIYLLTFLWDTKRYANNAYDPRTYYIEITLNPAMSGSLCESKTFDISYPTGELHYRLLYFRATFLKHPYVTGCRDIYSETGCRKQDYLSCKESKYVYQDYERIGISPNKYAIIATASKHGIDVKVSSTMSLFDFISCTSSVIGFWLGLSILGLFELCIGTYKSRTYIFIASKIIVTGCLLIALSYFITQRFDEYLQYDVSTELVYSDTPHGIELPTLTYRFKKPYEWNRIRSEYDNRGISYQPSATEACKKFMHQCQWKNTSLSIVGHDGIHDDMNISMNSNMKCHMVHDDLFISANIGEFIGSWNSYKHKYIMLHTTHSCSAIVQNIYHMSESIVTTMNAHLSSDMIRFNDRVEMDYLRVKLIESPYVTLCRKYRDPSTYTDSWYFNLINGTKFGNMTNDAIVTSEYDNSPRYYNRSNRNMGEIPINAIKYIEKEKLNSPCYSITSVKSIRAKSTKRSTSHYIVEPKTIVSCIATPKIQPIDFFILLFDQIGFWLGMNFILVCILPFKLVAALTTLLGKKHGSSTIVNYDTVSSHSQFDYMGKRMTSLKYWRKYSETLRSNRITCQRSVDSSTKLRTFSAPLERYYLPRYLPGYRVRIINSAPSVSVKTVK